MARLASAPYDAQWIGNNNVDLAVLFSFRSPMKLETMFGRGVFRVGDIFRIVDASGATLTDVEATVSKFNFWELVIFS